MNRGSFQPSSYYEQLPLRRNCRCSCHRTGAIHVAPCCRGSVVFEDSAYGDAGGGKSKKKVSKPCQKAAEDHEKYLRLMWKATVFSAERVKYEKKASEAAKKLDSCHDTAKGGAGFGFPKESPIKLWSLSLIHISEPTRPY